MTMQEKTVVFHVGAEATGTWLAQRYITEHADALRAQGVYAPAQKVTAGFVRWGKLADHPDRLAAAIAQAFAGGRARTYLASHDSALGDAFSDDAAGPGLYPLARPGMVGLAEATRPHRTVVILTVRPQAEFLESYYVRVLNAGGFDTFDAWLAKRDLDDLSWLPLHRTLVDIFGADSVRVVDAAHPGVREAIDLRAFFAAAGIEAPTPLDGTPVFGKGISERAMRLALAANAHLTSYDERAGLRAFLQKHFPEDDYPAPTLLSDAQRAALDERYSAEYAELVGGAPVQGGAQ